MDAVKLTLENFRNEMDEKVLERGWFYFSKGWVRSPKEIMPGYFECVVHEVVPHAVSYSLSADDEITDVFCTCGETASRLTNSPHSTSLSASSERTDAAPGWCRHLAAVLFALESYHVNDVAESEHII